MSSANFSCRPFRFAFFAILPLAFKKQLAVKDAIDLDSARIEEEGRATMETVGGIIAATGAAVTAGGVNLQIDVAQPCLCTEARTWRALQTIRRGAVGNRESMSPLRDRTEDPFSTQSEYYFTTGGCAIG